MAIFDLYEGDEGKPEKEFTYAVIPPKLKNQFIHIIRDFSEQFGIEKQDAFSVYIRKTIAREHGLANLPRYMGEDFFDPIRRYLSETNALETIQVFQIGCQVMVSSEIPTRESSPYLALENRSSEAIKELNTRFLKANVGYQFEITNYKVNVIKLDNVHLHKETVRETLILLQGDQYNVVSEDYLLAHSHFVNGNLQDANVACLRAFESMIKVLAKLNNWGDTSEMTSSKLIDLLSNKNFGNISTGSFKALRSVLEQTLPPARNKHGGHGDDDTKEIPEPLTRFLLYHTGAVLRYLYETQQLSIS